MSRKKLECLASFEKLASFNRAFSRERSANSDPPTTPSFSSVVLLAMNLRKSPWLLSRCKKTLNHVQAIQKLLKDVDNLKVIIKLAGENLCGMDRYLVLVSSLNVKNEEEHLLLGVDVFDNLRVTIGMILPITMETDICLDGDGGFFISNTDKKYSFQPISVQEMWSALQALVKSIFSARNKNHQRVSTDYYQQLPRSDLGQIYEWERTDDLSSSDSIGAILQESKECFQLKTSIRRKLQEILMNADLENVTSKQVRDKLEETFKMNLQENLGLSLSQYKQYIDEELILVMRQMDSPSHILDFLYLGSEWNASNLEELKKNGVGYILNVTKEIDNFFPGMFKYCNVRVYDYEEAELLKHWNGTFNFISEAREKNSNILVHCKMGVSRSASTVIAFLMKYYQWSVEQAYQHVKQKRSCVQPNPGFMQQLITYQGILDASKHRHSKLFRSKSINSLDVVGQNQSTPLKNRPQSNAEARSLDVVDNDFEDEKETSPVELPIECSSSETFVIMDANHECLIGPETATVLSNPADDEVGIDESKLSSSSVLRQWSFLPEVQFRDEKDNKNDETILEGIFDEPRCDSSFKISNSWPGGINVKFPSAHEVENFKNIFHPRGLVRFNVSSSKQKLRKKERLKKFKSMIVE